MKATHYTTYICVAPDPVNVRSGIELSSFVVRQLKQGDVIRGLRTQENQRGDLRVQLNDGNWTSIRPPGKSAVHFLHVAECDEKLYICVDSEPVNVRTGMDLESKSVRKLQQGQLVRGVLTCKNRDGHIRLKLDDGNWTSIRAAQNSKDFLHIAKHVDKEYLCVSEIPINVRKGIDLTSARICQIQPGEIVHGRLTCTNSEGHKRVQLTDGSWTSIRAANNCADFLQTVDMNSRHYVCIDQKPVNIRMGIELDSEIVCKLHQGELIHGVCTHRNKRGDLRVKLENDTWTSIRAAGYPTDFLHVADVEEKFYVCVSLHSINVRETMDLESKSVRQLQPGSVVRGMFTCTNKNGDTRVKLDDGNWTSVCAFNSSEPFLIAQSDMDMSFVQKSLEKRIKVGNLLPSRMYGTDFPDLMHPCDIRYCQDSIARRFRCGRQLTETLQQLRIGYITVDSLPTIEVFPWRGSTFSADNRRLWVFKQFGAHVPVRHVSLASIDRRKLTTVNNGESIRIR